MTSGSERGTHVHVDILGEPYVAETIDCAEDEEGPVVATLVSRTAGPPTTKAVVHLHGFADYFFQTAAADFWVSSGYDFYAIDLRKCGRSIRPHQTPNFVTDLTAYFEEIDVAMRLVRERDGHDDILLSAHSTGGLIAALWADARRPRLSGAVLNSPWLDLHASLLHRTVGTALLDWVGPRRPYQVLRRPVSGVYGESLHREHHGEWDFDLAWKPLASWPIYAGWLRAVRRGQARIHRGVELGAPVLVLTSAASTFPTAWDETVSGHDIVLDVQQIRRWAHRLGQHVTLVSIPGAMHDITLSSEPVRKAAFVQITRWLTAHVQ